jgi:phage terminase large subunit-like protein
VTKRTPGPKLLGGANLDLTGLPEQFPERAFALLERFGYSPYRWQREEIAYIYGDRANVAPVVYVQIAKKNGKTALAVMVALIEMCLFPERHIYAVSDSQTNLSSVFWLELNTKIIESGLESFFSIYQLKITNPDTGSFIQMRPGNFAASQGINAHLVIVDEVHLMVREVWNGYLMSGDARPDPLVLGITTPGYNFDCAAFDIYNDAKAGSDPDLHATIYEPSDPECDPANEEAWKQSNPAYEESPPLRRALARHCRKMRVNDFRRFRLGQWTATERAWFPHGVFASRAVSEPIAAGERVALALDGSWSGDTTALTATNADCKVQVIGHWKPPVMNDGSWRVDMSKVEQSIRDACAYYEVVEIAFDPARWSRNMQALAAEGLPVVEFPQSPQRMVTATTLFFDAVMDDKLTWVNDELGKALAAHVAMAEVEEGKNGAMIKKPSFAPATSNIDCAVSAVMSHARATVMPEPTDYSLAWVNIHRSA